MGANDVQVMSPTAMDVDIQSRQGNVVSSSDSRGQFSPIEQEGNVGPPVIRIDSDTPVSGNTPVSAPRTITETVCVRSLRQSVLELETSDRSEIEERVLRAEQNRLREVEETSRQKMEEEYSRMVNELTANSRVELDQYRTEMRRYYEDKWKVVESLAESKYARARKEMQEAFRHEQTRYISLVQQDLERVQRQREQTSRAQDEAF
eukprot:2676916-Amphidinium_carterae.1